MSIESLISRLQKVKSTGRGRWMCACPAHNDKSPSMHIKLEDDGKILINCKAGCGTYEILRSVGLDWVDVMPESPTHHRQKPRKQVLYASEALQLIRFEAMIIVASGMAMVKGTLTTNDLDRVKQSMQTINKVVLEAGL